MVRNSSPRFMHFYVCFSLSNVCCLKNRILINKSVIMDNMVVSHYSGVPEKKVETDGAKGTSVRWLISPKTGAKNFAMRYFIIKKGGHTPLHKHDYEHEIFVVKGEGWLTHGSETDKMCPGSFALVKPDELHQLKNESSETLEFICLIPARNDNIPPSEAQP
jgi:quercetin dioxygenase-like cupin family protein